MWGDAHVQALTQPMLTYGRIIFSWRIRPMSRCGKTRDACATSLKVKKNRRSLRWKKPFHPSNPSLSLFKKLSKRRPRITFKCFLKKNWAQYSTDNTIFMKHINMKSTISRKVLLRRLKTRLNFRRSIRLLNQSLTSYSNQRDMITSKMISIARIRHN